MKPPSAALPKHRRVACVGRRDTTGARAPSAPHPHHVRVMCVGHKATTASHAPSAATWPPAQRNHRRSSCRRCLHRRHSHRLLPQRQRAKNNSSSNSSNSKLRCLSCQHANPARTAARCCGLESACAARVGQSTCHHSLLRPLSCCSSTRAMMPMQPCFGGSLGSSTTRSHLHRAPRPCPHALGGCTGLSPLW